jgi:hypothetical protein
MESAVRPVRLVRSPAAPLTRIWPLGSNQHQGSPIRSHRRRNPAYHRLPATVSDGQMSEPCWISRSCRENWIRGDQNGRWAHLCLCLLLGSNHAGPSVSIPPLRRCCFFTQEPTNCRLSIQIPFSFKCHVNADSIVNATNNRSVLPPSTKQHFFFF